MTIPPPGSVRLHAFRTCVWYWNEPRKPPPANWLNSCTSIPMGCTGPALSSSAVLTVNSIEGLYLWLITNLVWTAVSAAVAAQPA